MKILKLNLTREGSLVKAFFGYMRTEEANTLIPDFLAPWARDYFDRLTVNKRRDEFLCGQYLLRNLAQEYLGNNDFEVQKGAFTQPLIQSSSFDTPSVSLSHSGGLVVALAFPTGHPMGIDIEKLDSAHAETIKKLLSPSELEAADSANDVIQFWSMKEAVSKATLCGLMVPPEILEIENIEKSGNLLETRYKNFKQYRCYSVQTKGYALSVTMPFKSELDWKQVCQNLPF